jgi:hypothetical protein
MQCKTVIFCLNYLCFSFLNFKPISWPATDQNPMVAISDLSDHFCLPYIYDKRILERRYVFKLNSEKKNVKNSIVVIFFDYLWSICSEKEDEEKYV